MLNNIVNYYRFFFSYGKNNNSEVSKSEKNIVLTDSQKAIKGFEKILKSIKLYLNLQNYKYL
jgi:hypothetical protein